jgi:Spy/CpxP family protein refolding chaperone
MKKTTLILVAIVAVLAIAAVPFVYAGPGHHHGKGEFGPLGHLDRAQQELGLSDQQVAQIKTIFTDLRTQNSQYRDQIRAGLNGVMTTLLKNPNDIAGAQAIINQQAQAELVVKTNLLNAASKALNVLTPEQRDKLGTLIAKKQQKFQRQF